MRKGQRGSSKLPGAPEVTAAARCIVEGMVSVACLIAEAAFRPGKPSEDLVDSDRDIVGDSSGIRGVPLPNCNLLSTSLARTTMSEKLEKISVMPFLSMKGDELLVWAMSGLR